MTTTLILRKTTTTETAPEPYFEADATIVNANTGTVPFHTHKCLDGNGHPWRCNSPYCNQMVGLCPDHGGDEPIKVGREPWRGR
jgi:hypothetical protein